MWAIPEDNGDPPPVPSPGRVRREEQNGTPKMWSSMILDTAHPGVCPAGTHNERIRNSTTCECNQCPPGTHKSTDMRSLAECVQKSQSCPGSKVLHTVAALFGRESTTSDDTVCLPQGHCPAGSRPNRQSACTACPPGKFGKGTGVDMCVEKSARDCPAGVDAGAPLRA